MGHSGFNLICIPSDLGLQPHACVTLYSDLIYCSGFKNCKSDNEVGIPVIKSNETRDISMMVLWLEETCGEGKLWQITT